MYSKLIKQMGRIPINARTDKIFGEKKGELNFMEM